MLARGKEISKQANRAFVNHMHGNLRFVHLCYTVLLEAYRIDQKKRERT